MKLRLSLILLLFVASVGVLVWLYDGKAFTPPRHTRSTWHEIIADLEACGRRKHLKARQYAHFAEIAATEKRFAAEGLFRAIACSEQLQEQNLAAAIRRLGGSYTPPKETALYGSSTADNLERCIGYERYRFRRHSDAEIRRAMSRGNRYAMRLQVWSAATDLREIMLLEHLDGVSAEGFAVCPRCGNLYDAAYLDRYCPHCLTSGEEFIRFGPDPAGPGDEKAGHEASESSPHLVSGN